MSESLRQDDKAEDLELVKTQGGPGFPLPLVHAEHPGAEQFRKTRAVEQAETADGDQRTGHLRLGKDHVEHDHQDDKDRDAADGVCKDFHKTAYPAGAPHPEIAEDDSQQYSQKESKNGDLQGNQQAVQEYFPMVVIQEVSLNTVLEGLGQASLGGGSLRVSAKAAGCTLVIGLGEEHLLGTFLGNLEMREDDVDLSRRQGRNQGGELHNLVFGTEAILGTEAVHKVYFHTGNRIVCQENEGERKGDTHWIFFPFFRCRAHSKGHRVRPVNPVVVPAVVLSGFLELLKEAVKKLAVKGVIQPERQTGYAFLVAG